jgi:hypothetical protein
MEEMADLASVNRTHWPTRLVEWFDTWILPTPFQKGGFHFVWRTLFRSEVHRLALASILGLGIVLSSQFLASAVQTKSAVGSTPSADALAVPFVLAFLIVVGLRIVFEIPADLRQNWVFRFTLDAEHHQCATLARKVILAFVLPWLFLVGFPLYVHFDGWLVASLHILLAAAWSMLLANVLLMNFRKFPFTCPMPVFQQHSIVTLLGGALGFFFFAIATPQAEARALAEPVWMLAFVPVAALFWYIPRQIEKDAIDVERRLVFEEAPSRAVQVLQLRD